MFLFAVLIILVALTFDFLNGFHDAANSIATVVSTRVLSPRIAVVWAAFFNFIAAFTFGTAVAKTLGKGMIDLRYINLYVILAGLLGAIFWNLFTWYYGLPVSSSHALMGGYAGAAVAKAGWGVILPGGWTKTLIFIVLSPAIGMKLGAALMISVYWIFRHSAPLRVDRYFRRLQLFSAAAYSFGHGTNDAQKTMGIIAGVLLTAGLIDHFYVPFWVRSEEHTSELQSRPHLVCRLLLGNKNACGQGLRRRGGVWGLLLGIGTRDPSHAPGGHHAQNRRRSARQAVVRDRAVPNDYACKLR